MTTGISAGEAVGVSSAGEAAVGVSSAGEAAVGVSSAGEAVIAGGSTTGNGANAPGPGDD